MTIRWRNILMKLRPCVVGGGGQEKHLSCRRLFGKLRHFQNSKSTKIEVSTFFFFFFFPPAFSPQSGTHCMLGSLPVGACFTLWKSSGNTDLCANWVRQHLIFRYRQSISDNSRLNSYCSKHFTIMKAQCDITVSHHSLAEYKQNRPICFTVSSPEARAEIRLTLYNFLLFRA